MSTILQDALPPADFVFPDSAVLPDEDEVPLATIWHRYQINLLVESVDCHRLPRTDHVAAGNTFIYYHPDQTDEEKRQRPEFRGPDFFFVKNVDGLKKRRFWCVWEEGGRYPDVIVELMSPSTAAVDLGIKKEIFSTIFETSEYYCFDHDTEKLLGWRLGKGNEYRAIKVQGKGYLWCQVLGLWLGTWQGSYLGKEDVWLRFFTKDYRLVKTFAEVEKERAEQEKQRADALADEVVKLRKMLAQKAPPVVPKKNGKNGKNGKK